jgi:hypothetical protein
MLERGKAGLKEISIKHKLKREVIDNKCQKREIEEEQDPNRQACERLIQLGGGDISDTVNVNGLEALQTAARKASEVKK